MQLLAAEVIAALATDHDRPRSSTELAEACGGTPRDVTAACAALSDWGCLRSTEDGLYALVAPASRRHRRVVLVCENSAAVAHVVAALLESEGYGVLIARTLSLGLQVAAAACIDLVIADSFANSARAALNRLQELRRAAYPAPVFLFSGHRDVSEQAAQAAGYAGLLPKPFDIDHLLARVALALSVNGK